MDGAPSDGHATGSQIPSLLRQRMLNRASTFAEGVRPSSPNLPRRRSSLLSNLSDAQQSFRSSTDSLHRTTSRNNDMSALAASDDSTWWHSSPVFIAIIPAIAALTHPNGGTIATDLVLLILSAWFLSKCADTPWQWYLEARQRQYVEDDDPAYDDTILEEDEDSTIGSPERPSSATNTPEDPKRVEGAERSSTSRTSNKARDELKRTELLAFVACFVGPLLGAFLLHNIRSQFTHRTRDGIVTDLHLTIYMMGAEIRPMSRLMKMVNERTLHLQRIVRAESRDQSDLSSSQRLPQRLAELEARFDGPMQNSDVDVAKITAEVRQSMQLQLDALNRAVRKYEKRHMAQSIQIEARFQGIDERLKDTLSLAAAAARTGQKPGIVAMTLSWIASVFAYGLQMAWDISMYPFRVISSLIDTVQSLFVKDERNARRRTKSQFNGHSSIPGTPRVQSKSGR